MNSKPWQRHHPRRPQDPPVPKDLLEPPHRLPSPRPNSPPRSPYAPSPRRLNPASGSHASNSIHESHLKGYALAQEKSPVCGANADPVTPRLSSGTTADQSRARYTDARCAVRDALSRLFESACPALRRRVPAAGILDPALAVSGRAGEAVECAAAEL